MISKGRLMPRCRFGQDSPARCPEPAAWRIHVRVPAVPDKPEEMRLYDCCEEHATLVVNHMPGIVAIDDLTDAGRVFTRPVVI